MYTIGEFSKIAHVSARMLRYYESLRLIHPANVGSENGYRYYDSNQLDTIFEIQKLQSYGVKLKDIPIVLSKNSLQKHDYYKEVYKALLEEQYRLNLKIQLLHEQIQLMEGNQMEKKKVILLDNPKQCVYSIKRHINIKAEEIQKLFHDLYTELDEKGIKRTGPTQLAYLSYEYSTENIEVEAQAVVSEGTPNAHSIPACTCISTLHQGPHNTIHTAYEALGKWMKAHSDYHICGPVIERFLVDDHENNHFETGVLFPVIHQN